MHAADLLSARARLTPYREALLETHSGQRHTYAQLNAGANRAANLLRAGYGIKAGDRVSIIAHNSAIYLHLLYGLPKIGAIFAPLNWRLTARELVPVLEDMKPSVLLVGPEFVGIIAELAALIQLPQLISIEGARIDAPAYTQLMATSSAAEPERPALDGETIACLLYTSGTSGVPKGTMIPHRQIVWNCINTVVSWGLRDDDVTPVFTPLFHTGGLFAYLTPVLYAGGRVVLSRTFDAEQTVRAIVEERCTVILGVPTLYALWVETDAWKRADFSHVRHFNNGGAPCPPALMERIRREKSVIFRQGYGLTEVGPNCFTMTDEESESITGCVGRPILHSSMRLIDPATGAEVVAAGVSGELQIRGPHVCLGYWNKPDATNEVLTVDGWFRTGDMAVRDEHGVYRIAGRYKDMIKSGGENIFAAEVEAVLRDHPAVADAALIGMPDRVWGEVGLMIVLVRAGYAVTAAELAAHCDGRLARYKIPKHFEFADTLPYSSYGKVLKNALREKYLAPVQVS